VFCEFLSCSCAFLIDIEATAYAFVRYFVYCEGSVLRRWKKNWFVLYKDGVLKYFDSPDSHVAEEAFLIPTKLLTLKTAHQVVHFPV